MCAAGAKRRQIEKKSGGKTQVFPALAARTFAA
jgi:hypothetical protein